MILVTPVVEKVTGDKNVQPTKVVGTNQVVIKTRALSQDEKRGSEYSNEWGRNLT